MSEAKHTPGPWKAGRPDMATVVDGVDSKWIYSADDQYVAVASGQIRGSWEEVMANARLIAAAPELIEAVRELVARFAGDDDYGLRDASEAEIAAVRRARAAIAKAEGR